MRSTVRLGAATRLSEAPRESRAIDGRFFLARLSLPVLALMLSGCLIEDPPPLQKAKQTPPRLDYQGATPFLDRIVIATSNTPIPFSIPVSSEDSGEGLVGYLLLDYVSGDNSGTLLTFPSNLAPSTLNDSERAFKFSWTPNAVSQGCHRITLLAGHASTLFDLKIVDTSDLAVAYWWVNVNVSPEEANVLRDCPDASRPMGTAP